jgi:alkanesulfonate monooxygenase SsuD/methylene tetrahydromethanopterin reductase-like flavin-dependent oxidoreductase (luciferase family)
MRISTLMSYSGGFKEAVAEIKALEKAGLDVVWVPEAYSFDAPTAMGYLAAETERVIIANLYAHAESVSDDRGRP